MAIADFRLRRRRRPLGLSEREGAKIVRKAAEAVCKAEEAYFNDLMLEGMARSMEKLWVRSAEKTAADFAAGFQAAREGLPVPPDASDDWARGYRKGQRADRRRRKRRNQGK